MIITKSGKQFEAKGLLFDEYNSCFHVHILNSTLDKVAKVFKNSKETSELVFKTEKRELKLNGYVDMVSIVETGNSIQLTMRNGGGYCG